ncbi:MAG: hypothetical protein SOY17_10045 [Evtepia sp.]|nr:hypothetical protein [Evtepia sp.]
MAALTTLNITEKNANNSLSVTVKVNITKEGVFTTTLSKEDVDKIHSYGIKLPTNRLSNEGYFNSIALSDLESQIREVLKKRKMEREDIEKAAKSYQEKDHDIWTGKGMAVELQKAFKAGASWRIGSVWHPITIIPECYRLAIFIPKKVGMTKRFPVMGVLEENKVFVSSRPGCILYRFYEMESWAYLDDLLP